MRLRCGIGAECVCVLTPIPLVLTPFLAAGLRTLTKPPNVTQTLFKLGLEIPTKVSRVREH